VILTLLTSNRQSVDPATTAAGIGYNNSSKWLQNGDAAKYISIEVLSSKNRVRICVDDATVIYTLFTYLTIFSKYKYVTIALEYSKLFNALYKFTA